MSPLLRFIILVLAVLILLKLIPFILTAAIFGIIKFIVIFSIIGLIAYIEL